MATTTTVQSTIPPAMIEDLLAETRIRRIGVPPAKRPPEFHISESPDSHGGVPGRLLFAPRIDPRLKITKPFDVVIEKTTRGVAARVDEITEFGYGSNRSEAVDDLGRTLAELYFFLRADVDRLSADLLSVYEKLQDHVELLRP